MKKTIRFILAGLMLLVTSGQLFAQQTFPRNGVYDEREGWYVFTNATIHTHYNQSQEGATLVIHNGKIEAVGKNVFIPKGAIVTDLKGKHLYPSFIDLYTNYGLPEAKAVGKESEKKPQMLSNKEGAFAWNEALKPEYRAAEDFKPDDKSAATYRKLGFGCVLTHQMDGISRGTSAAVLLGKERPHEMMLSETGAHHLSFNKGKSTQAYPSSLMGIIALLRQTYYDGQWYAQQKGETNLSLEAWNAVQSLPQIIEVGDRLEVLRAAKLAKEFGKDYIIMGSGDEYQRLNEIKATGATLILPLDFPEAYDVEAPFDALQVTLAQMKHWELAPTNPARLAEAGIKFALTTHELEKKDQFMEHLRKAIKYGLSEEAALKALTETPAQLLNLSDQLGSLETGKVANFIITDGPVFAKESKIYQNWIGGKPFELKDLDAPDLLGKYALRVGNQSFTLHVSGKAGEQEMKLAHQDTTTLSVKHTYDKGILTLVFSTEKEGKRIRLSGTATGKNWSGRGQDIEGNWVNWSATYQGPPDADKKKREDKKDESIDNLGVVTYPFTAFGWENRPQATTYLIRNATVWTNEAEGKLENTDILVRNGKIAEIGPRLSDRSATIIDGTGKHLTAGIIDEHTHIAASRGINEGTQASSAEVRIGDVINSEDINIYRQLSGGVTTSQVLHGSSNPIGGQSGLIKLRWGFAPEEMKVANADGFIKFALGENVKQSNRNNDYNIRFPQTRMGVEQVYVDHFTRAREYGKLRNSGKPYRRDLDLETILEIIEGKRFITCHSYQQGEINMLMKVAERFGFRVNTFTHILEGYKVADKMAAHGAGGSTFADWWAYKFEVIEAIPYNSALMHEQGVTVAVNSDDAEMARRLNQEAAKAVLFGGVSEEDALKFVTLNPAKLLHIDQQVGSIKVGKDADIVLWSDHPLSVYAKADKTFVDGILFFDRDQDIQLRQAVQKERARLVQKMLAVKKEGGKMQPARGRSQYREYHCDDLEREE
ncbi:MAG: periplasmic amidohydrolase [Saprospiraceae bacterium]|nr:MAG: periplasmic amidohydrolase [Saprospiraceae bacterium]